MRNKFIVNTFFVYLLQATNILAPLIVLPYLARTLYVHDYGMVSLFVSICGLAFIINDFGFSLCATYWISKSRSNTRKISAIITSIYYIKIYLFLITTVILAVYFIYSNLNFGMLFIFNVFGVVLCQSYQPVWYFQGIEKMKLVTYYMLSARITYVLTVIFFVKNSDDINIVYFSYCLSNLIAAIISNYFMLKNGIKLSEIKRKYTQYCARTAFGFCLSRASLSVYSTASTFIIGNFIAVSQAAIYATAEKIYQALQSIGGPLTQALLPHLARNSDHGFMMKIIKYSFLPILCISITGVIFSDEVIRWVFGSKLIAASEPLKLFFIIFVINFINTNFGYPAFAVIKKINIVNYTVFLGGVIQLCLLCFLIFLGKLSVVNVVLSILFTETIVATTRIVTYFFLKKTSGKNNVAI